MHMVDRRNIAELSALVSERFTEIATTSVTVEETIAAARLVGDRRIVSCTGEVVRIPKEGYTMTLIFRIELWGQPWPKLGFEVVGYNPRTTKNRGLDRVRFLTKVPLDVPLEVESRLLSVKAERNGGTTLWSQTRVWGPGDRDRPVTGFDFGTTYRD